MKAIKKKKQPTLDGDAISLADSLHERMIPFKRTYQAASGTTHTGGGPDGGGGGGGGGPDNYALRLTKTKLGVVSFPINAAWCSPVLSVELIVRNWSVSQPVGGICFGCSYRTNPPANNQGWDFEGQFGGATLFTQLAFVGGNTFIDLSDGLFHRVLMTYNVAGSQGEFYRDLAHTANFNCNGLIIGSGQPLVLGCATQENPAICNCSLDFAGIRISNVMRPPQTSLILRNDVNCIGFWTCNEGYGNVLNDLTGHGNNGIFVGGQPPEWITIPALV